MNRIMSGLTNNNDLVVNPYGERHLSYKDALLSEMADSSNRLGINTFQLLHRLNRAKSHEGEEVDSNSSEMTDQQNNVISFKTHRMRFQVTVSDTTAETYMEDLVSQINKVLEVINVNTPGVQLAPWHSMDVDKKDLILSMTDDPTEAVKYLYGFKAGLNKSGTQYLRIHMAFPSHLTAEYIVTRNKNSVMIPGKQTLLVANSQSINPRALGWLLRSNPSIADIKDLEQVLKALWQVQGGFGSYWAAVKDGKPYNPNNTARAIHIETEEKFVTALMQKAERTYGKGSKRMEDYPLGINMMFVQPFGEVKGSAKALVTKYASYQLTNDKMLSSTSWYGNIALERSIYNDKFVSLRQWLMSINSLTEKMTRNGTTFKDKLFASIHRDPEMQETKFYFYKANEQEAQNVISSLPLLVRDELGIDPYYFFHRTDCQHVLEGAWEAAQRVYKNKKYDRTRRIPQ